MPCMLIIFKSNPLYDYACMHVYIDIYTGIDIYMHIINVHHPYTPSKMWIFIIKVNIHNIWIYVHINYVMYKNI